MPFLKSANRLQQSDYSKKKAVVSSRLTVSKLGFTLIELLVVIAIIGILTSLITYSFTDSQKKSRDSRRKSDLESIRKALELAKQDSAGNYSYPKCDSYFINFCLLTNNTVTNPDLSPTYIKSTPLDPKNNAGYIYQPSPDSCGTSVSCTAFTLMACLENSKDSQKDDPINSICSSNSMPASYTITNL